MQSESTVTVNSNISHEYLCSCDGCIFCVGTQALLSVALGIPTRKRKPLTEEELELRQQRRQEAAAKRAKVQQDMKKEQQKEKYKKK